MQTEGSVFHPDTMLSARGAAITVGHPIGQVRPDNWKDLVVGNTTGEPRKLTEGRLGIDILLGDVEAIGELESGTKELSIGKTFRLEQSKAGDGHDFHTVGPILINHIALVEKGRAGLDVKVFDDGGDMDGKAIALQVATAVTDALKPLLQNVGGGAPDVAGQVSTAVQAAVQPVMDSVQALQNDAKAAEDARKMKEDEEAQKKAAAKLTTDVQTIERARFAGIQKVLPLIASDKREAMLSKDLKDVLVAAVGDKVQNAASQTVDYLQGVADMMAKALPAGGVQDTIDANDPGRFASGPIRTIDEAKAAYMASLTQGQKDKS